MTEEQSYSCQRKIQAVVQQLRVSSSVIVADGNRSPAGPSAAA